MATTSSSGQNISQPTVDESLEPDELFHSLQNERRRRVLRILADADEETFAMGDIAVRVAAAENECPEQQVTSDQRKRVYVALYQHHLPQLDDVGLVEYEQNRGHVRGGPALDQVTAYLEMTAPADARDDCEEEIEPVQSTQSNDGWDTSRMWLGASGSVAAVGLLASGATWGGVLGPSITLAAVLGMAVLAFAVAVAVAYF